jgi:putative phage-type endonuclease
LLVLTRTTIDKPADREEWLAVRRPYFNASAAAVLYDRHPYVSPGDLATIKLTGEEQASTKAMRRGTFLEDAIAQWWAQEHGCAIAPVDQLYVADRVMATLDRWAIDDGCPIEIKTTSLRAHEPEPYWLYQCQAIMLCAGADACWLVWFDSSMALHERLIEGDEALQLDIADRAERFMAAIDLGIVPDWVDLSYQNISALHPLPLVEATELDDDGLSLVRELATLRQIQKDAAKEEGACKDALAKLLLDHDTATWEGHEVLTWKATKPTLVLDKDMLAADHPDLVEKYMRERPGSRRMLTKLEVTV